MGIVNPRSINLLASIFVIQSIECVSIVLNVPFVRQIVGFFFLIFVPGYLILRVLKQAKSGRLETILFSAGLSIAFLLLIGLLINSLGSANLLTRPLSTEYLVITINIAVAVLALLCHFTDKDVNGSGTKELPKIWQILPVFVLPLSSVLGAMSIFYFHNYVPTIAILISVPIIFAVGLQRSRLSPYYPLIIISIVVALLLSNALTSNYVFGDDIQGEFNVFEATRNRGFWNPQEFSFFQQRSDNAMLSVTILPTMLSNILNIGPDWTFKIVYPVFYALVVLGLYELYRRHWGRGVAFISVFFFLANYQFFTGLLTVNKNILGEFFYVILFLVLLGQDSRIERKGWLILVFALFGLIVSHYSMAFIFLFLISSTWLFGKLLKNRRIKIDGPIIAFSFCGTFLWYLYAVQGPFIKIIEAGKITYGSFLSELFSPAARGQDIGQALGILSRPSLLHYFGTILYDATIVLILVGFISLSLNWRKGKFSSEFFLLITLCMGLLIAAVVVPNFAGFLELGRLYQILLVLLAPLFALGAKAILKQVLSLGDKKRLVTTRNKVVSLALISILLATFFWFQTGLFYEIARDPAPSSYVLSGYRMKYFRFSIQESNVASSKWLSKYGDVVNHWTFCDRISLDHVLNSYSTIDRSMLLLISNTTEKVIAQGTYIYRENSFEMGSNLTYVFLSEYNVISGNVTWNEASGEYFRLSEVPVMNNTVAFVNRIYSNSLSEVYYRTP